MRFLHTADLHIGKNVNDFSMLEEQKHALGQMLRAAGQNRAQAIVIAGDVYDRSIPPAEAVGVLDEFLTQCASEGIAVLLIAGNHDSPERLGFAEKILEKQGIYAAGNYESPLRTVVLGEAGEETAFVLMPFVKPAMVGAANNGEAVEKMLREYREAAGAAPEADASSGNGADRRVPAVLVTHYFVTDAGRSPELSDSETQVNVGGLDSVDASVFDGFAYVALGHIHKPQQIGGKPICYAGSPVKYSFSEANQQKCVNLVDVAADGSVRVERIALRPLHEMRVIRGRLEELIRPQIAALADREDYIQAGLTDETELIDPIGTLRSVYPNVMQLILLKNEENRGGETQMTTDFRQKSTLELFARFYQVVRGEDISPEQEEIAAKAAGSDKAASK